MSIFCSTGLLRDFTIKEINFRQKQLKRCCNLNKLRKIFMLHVNLMRLNQSGLHSMIQTNEIALERPCWAPDMLHWGWLNRGTVSCLLDPINKFDLLLHKQQLLTMLVKT